MNTAQLQRTDRLSLETKAAAFSIAIWLLIWISIAVTARFLYGDWYGFGAGFLVAPVVSIPLMWWIFARPAARERHVVRASWTESSLRIYDPIEDRNESVDFSKPHTAILILSKNDQEFMLRLEQNRHTEHWVRIDIIGHLPMALPMRSVGEARTLRGFHCRARTGHLKVWPYRLKDDPKRDNRASSLLAFVESFRQHRIHDIVIKRGDEQLRISDGHFGLHKPDGDVSFADMSTLRIATRVGSVLTKAEHSEVIRSVPEIQLALIPPTGESDALVFSLIAHPEGPLPMSNTPSFPDEVMNRRFVLYDDSVNSFVVTTLLKQYVKVIDPGNPVLNILRY